MPSAYSEFLSGLSSAALHACDHPWVLWVILLAPLAGFVINIFFGRRLPLAGHVVPTLAVLISFALSLCVFKGVRHEMNPDFVRAGVGWQWFWIDAGDVQGLGNFQVKWGFLLDNLTAIMLVVVTTVSLLVHLFSIGYMHGDKRYGRFFAFLGIFTFSMLGLILTDNLFGIYIFWELVGLASYLLIGFWFEQPSPDPTGTAPVDYSMSPKDASMKAFLTTRVGDIGMFIGVMTVFYFTGGSFNFHEVFQAVAEGAFDRQYFHIPGLISIPVLTFAGVALFCGAIGKSAQFPLHIWLPDAMAGPTPVSALIHAATMVAAGVYLVARLFPLFDPNALLVIAYVGGFTAIFAATIALCAYDLKKVLAYSTISQLGYMILGLGVGAYAAGVFHLWTHAFFKALLFLGSGSVIHAVHSQSMRDMGGLRAKMPVTFLTMLIATIAIAGLGIPGIGSFHGFGLSGFYSKDAILGGVLHFAMDHKQHLLLAVFGFGGALLTAFYMFRMIYLTFTGTPRDPHKFEHAHESPTVMTFPLATLAILAIISGWSWHGVVPSSALDEEHGWFAGLVQKPILENYVGLDPADLAAARGEGHSEEEVEAEHRAHLIAMWASVIIAFTGFGFATRMYLQHKVSPEALASRFAPLHRALLAKWYMDDIVRGLIAQPCLRMTRFLFERVDKGVVDALVNGAGSLGAGIADFVGVFDNHVVDGAVNGTADRVAAGGAALQKVQSGRLRTYLALSIGLAMSVLVVFLISKARA
ncbi:MAG: NADH-quinone oxidoreductase subunit L [Planctomycetes bacterium]|nr:NADH-quinone oxidoreductase subunit L [Planctomycetota bacterium]